MTGERRMPKRCGSLGAVVNWEKRTRRRRHRGSDRHGVTLDGEKRPRPGGRQFGQPTSRGPGPAVPRAPGNAGSDRSVAEPVQPILPGTPTLCAIPRLQRQRLAAASKRVKAAAAHEGRSIW